MSALLHGLNFQLASVLLSLGMFTYVEHRIRTRLAGIYSACILPSACKQVKVDQPAPPVNSGRGGRNNSHGHRDTASAVNTGCGHRYRSGHSGVMAFNCAAAALTIWHLAYLGLMFTAPTDEMGESMEEGFSYQHTMKRWQSLYFSSHLLMAVGYGGFTAMEKFHWSKR